MKNGRQKGYIPKKKKNFWKLQITLKWHKADDWLLSESEKNRHRWEGGISKGQGETPGRNGHYYYHLACDDDFTDVHMCQNLSNFTHWMCVVYCMWIIAKHGP